MTTEMVELKPCPFCGRDDRMVIATEQELRDEKGCDCDSDSDRYVAVFCDASSTSAKKRGGCGASGGFKPTRKAAIAAWNSRTP